MALFVPLEMKLGPFQTEDTPFEACLNGSVPGMSMRCCVPHHLKPGMKHWPQRTPRLALLNPAFGRAVMLHSQGKPPIYTLDCARVGPGMRVYMQLTPGSPDSWAVSI